MATISKIIIRPKHFPTLSRCYGVEFLKNDYFKEWIYSITGWNVIWIFRSFKKGDANITIVKGPLW